MAGRRETNPAEPALPVQDYARTLGLLVTETARLEAVTLRSLLARFATGVTVVTGRAQDRPVGLTVNSFTSVSLDPPLVLFCVRNRSLSGRAIVDSGAFAVNILGREQQDVARTFASRVADRFATAGWRQGATGSPILSGVLAYLDCRIVECLPGGDHAIVLGRPVDGGVRPDGEPLIFVDGVLGS